MSCCMISRNAAMRPCFCGISLVYQVLLCDFDMFDSSGIHNYQCSIVLCLCTFYFNSFTFSPTNNQRHKCRHELGIGLYVDDIANGNVKATIPIQHMISNLSALYKINLVSCGRSLLCN